MTQVTAGVPKSMSANYQLKGKSLLNFISRKREFNPAKRGVEYARGKPPFKTGLERATRRMDEVTLSTLSKDAANKAFLAETIQEGVAAYKSQDPFKDLYDMEAYQEDSQ
jgi:hypothetical protein